MRLQKVWLVAAKDLEIFRRKRSILYATIGFELIVAILLPLVVGRVAGRGSATIAILPRLIDAVSFWLVIGAAIIPIGIASYSLVGEKVQHSLEPLLEAPVTDDEVLAGKSLAAFLPAIVATYVGAVLFMARINAATRNVLHYRVYPNEKIIVMLLVLCPLAIVFSVGVNVLVSSRVSDVRTAQQLGSLQMLAFGAIYVLLELGVLSLTISHLLLIAAALLALVIVTFTLVLRTFNRNAILTSWK